MSKEFSDGFSVIELLVAKSIIFILLATFIPIYTTISYERSVLSDRIAITSALHDELQLKVWQGMQGDTKITRVVNNEVIKISFSEEKQFIKGCAKWNNKQGREEVRCLYGLEEK